MPWTRNDGVTPRGLAMVHLRNKNRGETRGRSELHKALPQQDALNKRMVDLDLVSDNQGYSQRWATGVTQTSVLNNHPGAMYRTESESAKFGQFPAADLEPLIKAIEMCVQHISGTTQTPYHLLNLAGGSPSGEALKTAESPLVKKAQDRMQTFTDCWRDIIRLLIRLGVDYGELALSAEDEAAIEIDIAWTSPESRSDESDWKVVGLKQAAGVSQHTTLAEMDYDADREAEMRKTETMSLGDAILTQFDNNTAVDDGLEDAA